MQGQKGIGLIQSLKKGAGFLCALVVYLADMQTQGQGTILITFDGPPTHPPGTVLGMQQYDESGMLFTPLGFSFARAGGGIPQLPENGTAYLQAALSQSLSFSFTDGNMFNLTSIDLAEYSTVVPDAVTVRFNGYRFDGSTVTTDLTTDGIIDGTGPIADFQTFNFGPEWSGLSHVEIPTYGWSLDNLVVSIPEPGTWALLWPAAASGNVEPCSSGRQSAPSEFAEPVRADSCRLLQSAVVHWPAADNFNSMYTASVIGLWQ